MKKEVKRRAIECAAAAVLYIVAIVGSSYAELEREMRLLIFLLPYLIMVFATVRLLWNNLKKRKLFDENLLILLATAGHLQFIAIRRQWERCCFSRLESCWNLFP